MHSSMKLTARFLAATALAGSCLNSIGYANDNKALIPPTPATSPDGAKRVIPVNIPEWKSDKILSHPKFIELRDKLLEDSVRADLTKQGLNKAATEGVPDTLRKERIIKVLREAVKTKRAKPAIFKLAKDSISENDLQKAIEDGSAQPGIIEFVKKELAAPVPPLTPEERFDYALETMFDNVSPHDSYLNKTATKAMNDAMSASFVGIGVYIDTTEGKIKVREPIENGPASKAGIIADDIIIGVDDLDVSAMDPETAVEKHILGAEGSRTVIKVLRGTEALSFPIIRALVKQKSVDYTMLDGGIAHFHVKNFSDQVAQELRERVAQAKAEARTDPVFAANGGLKGVILNFMYDPGGSLREARRMADDFIDKDGFVVTTEGRDIAHNEIYRSTKGDILNGLPMVVLVNEASASASEVVANALQDHSRAIVMGTPTFGKGTVQNFQTLRDGTAIKITISQFLRPSGTSNQLVGTVPDILVDTKDEDYEKARKFMRTERDLPGALKNDRGMAEQANRTKQVCSPANDVSQVVPEPARLKGVFNKEGKINPHLACARDYLLKQVNPQYAPHLTVTQPYSVPPAASAPAPAALRPNS